jgi:PE family
VIASQNAAAASATTGVGAAATVEVSTLTAGEFAAHTAIYQAASARAAAIHRCSSPLWDQCKLVCTSERCRQRDRQSAEDALQ